MPSSSDDRVTDGARHPALVVRPMEEADLDAVVVIEKASFASAWKREHFLHELRENRFAVNRILERRGETVGYASVWILDDELHINNIAVVPTRRREGLGRLLRRRLLDLARSRGCGRAALEVRPSNGAAIRLYRAAGFREIGRRRNYYAAEGEDAIVMALALNPLPR